MELVTVIVPVYNSEKYLYDCLTSIKHQTYTNLQVVVIDDGSLDSSYKIAQEFLNLDDRFELIHVENGGVSKARNIGLKETKGSYVFFVDSDDMIMPQYIENFMSSGKNDFVGSGYRVNSIDGPMKKYNNIELSIEEYVNDSCRAWELVPQIHVSGNRYVTKIIRDNDIQFDENCRIGEDIRFNIKYFKKIYSIKVTDKSEYIYRVHSDSAIHKFWPERLQEELEECQAKEELFVQNDTFDFIKYVHWQVALEHYYLHLKTENRLYAQKKLKETVRNKYFRSCLSYLIKKGTVDMKIAGICWGLCSYNLYRYLMKILIIKK